MRNITIGNIQEKLVEIFALFMTFEKMNTEIFSKKL